MTNQIDDKCVGNIKVIHYQESQLDKDVLAEIEYHEKEAIRLRAQLNMNVSFFIPEHHPIIFHNLLKERRRFEWNETSGGNKGIRSTYFVQSIKPTGGLKYILTGEEMKKAKADNVYYYEIECLFERHEPVVGTSGYSRERLINL